MARHRNSATKRWVIGSFLSLPRFTKKIRWSLACRGATIRGLEQSQPDHVPSAMSRISVLRTARHHYGIRCSLPFDESRGHSYQDRVRGPRGEWRADNQMIWMLRKGETIEDGRDIHQKLPHDARAGVLEEKVYRTSDILYYCADDEPPTRLTSRRSFDIYSENIY